jgi:3-oxoacyl-(acyl-carrier-protein) synthase
MSFLMTASIAGMGWVTPLGRDLFSVWTAMSENKLPNPALLNSPVNRRNAPVLRVPEELVRDVASLPRLRRSSTISHLAVAAAVDAVASARMTAEALKRTALVFAASDGGVVYTRRFYAEIVESGEGAGSPLLFPETVYNAPASHIAARLGLEGEVLTLVGDATAGLSAVQAGCELLAAGEADFCVVAAAQELDWITCEAYGRWGLIQDHQNCACLFSEGAAAIVLGRESESLRVSAIHSGYSYSTESDAANRLKTMVDELLHGTQADVVVSCASGTRLDNAEQNCIANHLSTARVLAPKFLLGESLACSTLQQVITGSLALGESGGGNALVMTTGYNRQLAGLVLTHKRSGD